MHPGGRSAQKKSIIEQFNDKSLLLTEASSVTEAQYRLGLLRDYFAWGETVSVRDGWPRCG
jgi:hypothetical protein